MTYLSVLYRSGTVNTPRKQTLSCFFLHHFPPSLISLFLNSHSDEMTARSLKNFSVVYFNSENRYSVVPSGWLDLSGDSILCFWPSTKTKNAGSLSTCAESIPEDDWTASEVQFIKSYGRHFLKLIGIGSMISNELEHPITSHIVLQGVMKKQQQSQEL